MLGNEISILSAAARLPVTHRFDVAVQEADRVDALYGLQDLSPQTKGGADAEGSPGHAPPQVSQVTTLREHEIQIFQVSLTAVTAKYVKWTENKPRVT